MSWIRHDDEFHDKPAIVAASLAAVGLDTLARCWSGRHLTDGHLPTHVVAQLARRPRDGAHLAAELCRVGLWEPTPEGFRIIDYLELNPAAHTVKKKRADAKERMRSLRDRSREHDANGSDRSREQFDTRCLGDGPGSSKSSEGECEGKPGALELTPECLVLLYHEHCPSLPRVSWIGGTRVERYAARLREQPDLAFWRQVFTTVESTPWLRGFDEQGRSSWPGATLDWLCENDLHATAVFEGKYRKPTAIDPRQTQRRSRTGALERIERDRAAVARGEDPSGESAPPLSATVTALAAVLARGDRRPPRSDTPAARQAAVDDSGHARIDAQRSEVRRLGAGGGT